MATLEIDAGRRTEDLLQFITAELDDETLDAIGVERRPMKGGTLASEPFTASAMLTLAAAGVVAVGRIIERWLEKQRQLEQLKLVAEGFKQSDEAGKALAKLSEKHAAVSIAYRLASAPAPKR
jgi:hypothetical protein